MLDLGTIAAIIVAVAAVGGLIIQWVKKEKPWKKGQTKLELKITAMEGRMESIDDSLDTIKIMLTEHETRDEKDFDRVEAKIEKLTELMIKLLSKGKS